VVVVFLMGVEDHQEGEVDLREEVVDLQAEADPQMEADPQVVEVEVDFWFEVQVCFLMLLG
jgi:hypothetical protein